MRSQNTPLASDDTRVAAQPIVSNSRLLAMKIAMAQPRLDAASAAFWTTADLRDRLPRFFQELYSVVHGGLAVMNGACRRAEELSLTGDPVAQPLARYLAHHIEEERDHDTWLLDDMEACGMHREAVQNRIARGPVASLLGAQMYWIEREHPVAFLGYMAAVEGNPPTLAHLDSVQQQTGFPAEAFRCMREHADADIAHADELRYLIDELPLTPRHHELIALSAFETIETLARIFDDLSASEAP
jgi:hypothetical protein